MASGKRLYEEKRELLCALPDYEPPGVLFGDELITIRIDEIAVFTRRKLPQLKPQAEDEA